MKAKWTGKAVPTLGDYLAERCEEDVKEHDIWLPVSHLTVESDLPFGTVVFRTISKEVMDRWEEDWQEAKQGRDAEYAAQVDYYFVRQRSELQGLAAATIKVTAEPKRALEVALRESERAVAALRIYHIAAAMFPEVTSYCVLLGREHVDGVKHLEMEGGRVRQLSDQDLAGPVLNFHLSDEEVSRNRKSFGFDEVSELLTLGSGTKFKEDLLDALLLYSRSTLEKDLTGRLVYTLVAMESLLLRDGMESIQQNVGERMAFIIASTVEERKAVIRNLKDAYVLRSRFIHHGHGIDELETVRTFLINVWDLFTKLAKAASQFETKEHLIDHLEAMKLS